ncbi:MAG: hypothetical protein AB8H03_19985 [Saprospiraceae bacterium]
MSIFRNPVWLFCVLLFIIHQFFQKILGWNFPILDSYLDPLLCLPIFMGLMLAERRFFLKKINHNKVYTFSILEIIVIAIVLSIAFEEGFPRWSNRFTKDYFDYGFYFVGALFFYFFINHAGSRSQRGGLL